MTTRKNMDWHYKRKTIDELLDIYDKLDESEQDEFIDVLEKLALAVCNEDEIAELQARISYAETLMDAEPGIDITCPFGRGAIWFAYTWDKYPGVKFFAVSSKKHIEEYESPSELIDEVGPMRMHDTIAEAFGDPWDTELLSHIAYDLVQWYDEGNQYKFVTQMHAMCGEDANRIIGEVEHEED